MERFKSSCIWHRKECGSTPTWFSSWCLRTILSDNCLSHYPGFGLRPYGVFANGEVAIVEQPDPEEFLKYTMLAPFAFFLSQHSYLFYFLNDNAYHKLYADQMRQLHKADLQKTENCGKYDVLYATINRIRQVLGQKAIALGLVLIPSRENVMKGRSEPLSPIAEHCRRQQILCWSLLEPSRSSKPDCIFRSTSIEPRQATASLRMKSAGL